eukprot:10060-Heterococcus_DN1.PRE.1
MRSQTASATLLAALSSTPSHPPFAYPCCTGHYCQTQWHLASDFQPLKNAVGKRVPHVTAGCRGHCRVHVAAVVAAAAAAVLTAHSNWQRSEGIRLAAHREAQYKLSSCTDIATTAQEIVLVAQWRTASSKSSGPQ